MPFYVLLKSVNSTLPPSSAKDSAILCLSVNNCLQLNFKISLCVYSQIGQHICHCTLCVTVREKRFPATTGRFKIHSLLCIQAAAQASSPVQTLNLEMMCSQGGTGRWFRDLR